MSSVTTDRMAVPLADRPAWMRDSLPAAVGRYGWLLVPAMFVAVSFALRGLLPIDETRYLSVAWEMWQRHDWLLPTLNGAPYSDKPPLVFWLYELGWLAFGVNGIWPRLVGPLAALGCGLLVGALARRLWPAEPRSARWSAWLLAGMLLWVLDVPMAMLDLPLAACVLLALYGVARAESEPRSGWSLFALGCCAGLLTKGPVTLALVLGPALLGALWREPAHSARGWYGSGAIALLAAVSVALAWALGAIAAGGTVYADDLLWSQTVSRLFGGGPHVHPRPVWWYGWLLPIALLPWTLWPPFWRALGAVLRRPDRGSRFLLCAILPALLILTLARGKTAHYLMPLLPAIALLAAHGLARDRTEPRRARLAASAGIAVGALLVGLPLLGSVDLAPYTLPPSWCGFAVALVSSMLLMPWRSTGTVIGMIAATTALVISIALGSFLYVNDRYDLQVPAHLLAELQARGLPLAHVGKYHAQYQFLGRLQRPLEVVEPGRLPQWRSLHPDGYVVETEAERPAPGSCRYVAPLRGEWLVIEPVSPAVETLHDCLLSRLDARQPTGHGLSGQAR